MSFRPGRRLFSGPILVASLALLVATAVAERNPEQYRRGAFGSTVLLGYGYLWWVWDGASAVGPYRGAYGAFGHFGQQITVVPVLDLVVVHKTRLDHGRPVSHAQYLAVLDQLVTAGCKRRAC